MCGETQYGRDDVYERCQDCDRCAAHQTRAQHAVREDMRGRVLSIWGLIFRGAPAIGVLLMGAASEYSSLGFVVLVAGLICLLVSLAGLRWRATLSLASATNHRGVGQDASVGGT